MIRARHPHYAWDALPASWLPDDPDVATIIDVLHLLLPTGERFFCRVFARVAADITDPVLRAQIDGFIRQEGWHAKTHADLLEHFGTMGLDTAPFEATVGWLFSIAERFPLRFRVAIIAAVEHFTTVLGGWILSADALEAAGADRQMLAMLRWHGAEEVEHRTVAFDTAHAVGVGYVERQLAYAIVVPLFVAWWIRGTRFLARGRRTRPTWRGFVRAGRRGLVPSVGFLVRATLRYPMPRYHPAREGDIDEALDFLARVAA